MARPKRVFPQKLSQFDKLHTRKIKMMSGVEITGLHIIKTTPEYYISIDSWSASCNPYKQKIKYASLQYDIPVITDAVVIDFLNAHAWQDWVKKQLNDEDSDMMETLAFLNKLFPEKKCVYFYELTQLQHSFNWGTFVSYDCNDCIAAPN